MNAALRFSADSDAISWLEAADLEEVFGPKGARLLTLPRAWTPPFALLGASNWPDLKANLKAHSERFGSLATITGKVIVRSSVLDETIWDRGTYASIVCTGAATRQLEQAVKEVLRSANGRRTGIVIQSYITPKASGEFGNLLRVSRTRDHWELSTISADKITSRTRFNTQRDRAPSPQTPIIIRAGIPPERLFGSVGAWLNNSLLRGHSRRVNVEWVTDNQSLFLVQIDKEDEDLSGVNPDQNFIEPLTEPAQQNGSVFRFADAHSLAEWDKLRVLVELWHGEVAHKPALFHAALSDLPSSPQEIARDFENLLGSRGIVVRTSVRAGAEKDPNLPRTECMTPDAAAAWCLETRAALSKTRSVDDLAFVAHRFIAAQASAWVRADPANPYVEIHALWGLPDALQFFPYDIWEVHLPTQTPTEYSDYKPHMLVPKDDGGWAYVRVKNEVARKLSIGSREALDLANRTFEIAQRLAQPVHVMWFVGCTDKAQNKFNVPWYWTKAHDTEKSTDRTNFDVFEIADKLALEQFKLNRPKSSRLAIELRPTSLDLMRDTDFVKDVARAAVDAGVPVILGGSTLAHAYFILTKEKCAVVPTGVKDHVRIRRHATFGKLVRDKIPGRIASRQETGETRTVPASLQPAFLIAKLLEEAMEVREASDTSERTGELADLLEVLRGLTAVSGISFDAVVQAADKKREAAGGFDGGVVLMQTAISRDRHFSNEADADYAQVLGRLTSGSSAEIPFSFFGFSDLNQPRSFSFRDHDVRVSITLKGDRLELMVSREPDQLELPLDMTVPASSDPK